MPIDLDLRGLIADYLGNEVSFEVFRGWFLEQAWNIDQRADAATAALAHDVELLLAEFDHGDWTKAELAEKLAPFVTSYTVTLGARRTRDAITLGSESRRVDTEPVEVLA